MDAEHNLPVGTQPLNCCRRWGHKQRIAGSIPSTTTGSPGSQIFDDQSIVELSVPFALPLAVTGERLKYIDTQVDFR
jgi:hypothetical protein